MVRLWFRFGLLTNKPLIANMIIGKRTLAVAPFSLQTRSGLGWMVGNQFDLDTDNIGPFYRERKLGEGALDIVCVGGEHD